MSAEMNQIETEISAARVASIASQPSMMQPEDVCSYWMAILYAVLSQGKITPLEAAQIKENIQKSALWREIYSSGKRVGIKGLKGSAPYLLGLIKVVCGNRGVALEPVDARSLRNLSGFIEESVGRGEPIVAWERDHAIAAVELAPANFSRASLIIRDSQTLYHRPMDIKGFAGMILKHQSDYEKSQIPDNEISDGHILVVKNIIIY